MSGKPAYLVDGDGDAAPPVLHLRRARPARNHLTNETDPPPVQAGLQLQGGPARYLKGHEAGLASATGACVRQLKGRVCNQLGKLGVDESPGKGVPGCPEDAGRHWLSDCGGYPKVGEDDLV